MLLPLAMLAILALTLWSSWASPPMTPYNYQRWVVMGGLVVLWALVGWWRRHVVQAALAHACTWVCSRPGGRWLALAACLLVLSAVLLSPSLFLALLELTHWLGFAGLMVLIAVSIRGGSLLHWQLIGGFAALALLVYSLMALDSLNFHWPIFTKRDATPGLSNIRHFSDLAVGLMPLGLVYVVARRRLSRAVALLTSLPLAVWWYLLFLTVGRSGVLSLTVAMLVVIVLFRRHAAWPVGTLLFSALSGLAAWWWLNPLRAISVDQAPAQTVTETAGELIGDITVTNDRIYLWQEAWQYAMEHFPLGVGPMGLAGDGLDFHVGSYAHAHNLFLNTAAEWGLPLALLLLALVLYGCWTIFQRARSMPEADQPLYACLVMAFVGVMVNVQFAGAQIIPLSSLVLVLAIGLVFGFQGLESPVANASVQLGSVRGPTILWVAGMLVVGYLFLAGWSLYQLSVESTRPCFQVLEETAYFPRFWAQGRLECMQMVAPDHWLFWKWP